MNYRGVYMSKIDIVRWEKKFIIAAEYYEEFGNLHVPDKYMYKGINLGNWLYIQRKKYREGDLSIECIERLDKIGMIWDIKEEHWLKMYELAEAFYKINGSLLIPKLQKVDDVYLGRWIDHQRQSYVKGTLSKEKIEKLQRIGMVWDASKSNISSSFPEQAIFFYLRQIYPDAINRCMDFKCEIDIYIPSIMTGIEYDGFAWHQNLEKDIAKNHKLIKQGVRIIRIREQGCPAMPEEKDCVVFEINRSYTNLHEIIVDVIIYLNGECNVDIDLIRDQMYITSNYINIYNSQWEKMYLRAKEFYEQNGNLSAPSNSEIGSWLCNQRQRYKHNGVALTADQIKKLNDIGMVWEPYKEAWNKMYLLAVQYYNENGDLNLAVNQIYEGVKLGTWIRTQRSKKAKGTLSEKYIMRLNEIGMIWDAQIDYDQCWEDMYEEAKKYLAKHGDLRVNLKRNRLGRWINTQRSEYAKGELRQDRINKLNDIGMVWDIFDADWDKMYDLACEYFNEYGDLAIKSYEQYQGQNLGAWIKRQCLGKENLSQEQIERLENLGIIWKRNENKWGQMYALAKKYYEENGNLLVNTHSFYEGKRLGQWINSQRIDYMNRKTEKENVNFSEERIKKLEEIGMAWNVDQYKWNSMYKLAEKYFLNFGNIDLSGNQRYEGVNLGKWIVNQRSAYRGYKGRKPLEQEQIERLNKLNMKW